MLFFPVPSELNNSDFNVQNIYFGFYLPEIIQLIQQSAMGYGNLSDTEVIISHEAKLSGIYETEVWDKSHVPWLVVG